ncbi:ABC transporter ATP-binding protein [Paenibacillus athensensis]|uniref:ABC transporter ATP-binding protein n=1 Tax=Paenibacillus athensensis TaxID=1967502 RepID=UPI00143206CA|nr:ABC transporter ATP-binding protein [Paenibacillus athensensis]MCD1259534.1 ABC transporter ATP-binding protein [Paenibacillus athensensis]
MSGDIAIRIENITKAYKLYDKPSDRLKEVFSFGRKLHKEFRALEHVDFEVRKGETVGIIGKNGSGKSTLLKIIAGTLTPTSGTIQLEGKVSALLELGGGFNPEYSGLENVYLNGAIMGFTKSQMEERLPAIIEFADIGDFLYQPVKTYSSGMFVRLAFAVSINVDPDILIVDEALSVGDMKFQKKCLEKIDALKRSGKTILFCSHDMHAIGEFCNSVVWIQNGRIAESGEAKKVISSYVAMMTEKENMQTAFVKDGNKHMVVKQSDEVEIVSVKLQDRNGKERSLFYTDEDLHFEMVYRAHHGIEEPIYSVLIHTDEGVPVALAKSSYEDQLEAQGHVRGLKTIQLCLKNIQLNTGKYLFGISIWDKNSKIIFAVNRTICFEMRTLKIAYGPMEQKTVYFIPAAWDVNPDQ